MTPQQIDAMKLALEWFKCYADKSMSRNNAEALADEVVDAIEKVLAEHAMSEVQRLGQEIEPDDIASILACREMLDAQPVPPQPEQEPVAHCKVRPLRNDESFRKVEIDWVNQPVPGPLYTAPPQRKPLTNGEIYTAYITATNQTLRATDERLAFAFARAIEAAHGIKEGA